MGFVVYVIMDVVQNVRNCRRENGKIVSPSNEDPCDVSKDIIDHNGSFQYGSDEISSDEFHLTTSSLADYIVWSSDKENDIDEENVSCEQGSHHWY